MKNLRIIAMLLCGFCFLAAGPTAENNNDLLDILQKETNAFASADCGVLDLCFAA